MVRSDSLRLIGQVSESLAHHSRGPVDRITSGGTAYFVQVRREIQQGINCLAVRFRASFLSMELVCQFH